MEIRALGCPPPEVRWLHDVTSPGLTSPGRNSELIIDVKSYQDYGVYEVVLKNTAGNANTSFQVVPRGEWFTICLVLPQLFALMRMVN